MDKTITLRNPVTGKERTGYYGFSRDALYTGGLIWLRRGDFWAFLTFVCTWIPLIWIYFFVPRQGLIDTIFNGAETMLGIPSIGIVYGFIIIYMIAFHIVASATCNKKHTIFILNRGFELDPNAPNLEEARKALGL